MLPPRHPRVVTRVTIKNLAFQFWVDKNLVPELILSILQSFSQFLKT